MSKTNQMARAVLRWPVLWGTLASLLFYTAIDSGLLGGSFLDRYFASHVVESIATTMFAVGVAALVIKMFDILAQRGAAGRDVLPSPASRQESAEQCAALIAQISQAPAALQHGYLGRRLTEALRFVQRKGGSETLDDQIRHLADVDRDRQHDSYSLVRIILWAIPILGFLGTVVGMTMAIGELSPEQLNTSIGEAVGGLKVAFDTTALALGLTLPLMFFMFSVQRIENRLLDAVDDRVQAELVGRFQEFGGGSDPNVAVIRRMAQTVVQSTERLAADQARIWKETIDASHQSWQRLAGETGSQVKASLTEALQTSLKSHAGQLAAAERAAAEQNRQHWDRVQKSLEASAKAVAEQQSELVRQGEVLLKVVDATGQVIRLEDTLNRNLGQLAGVGNFEETVTSLAAAIQLLSSKVGGRSGGVESVELGAPKSQQAA